MKFMTKIIAALSFLVTVGVTIALATPQSICPVMGNRVNPRIFTDYNGQRIYFCCPPCPEDFKKNPEFYLNRLKSIGQEPRKL